jgi:hypothetical protein
MKISSRAFTATVAAAGLTTLAASLIGTAMALAPNLPDPADPQNAPAAVPDASTLTHNGLVNIDKPTMNGALYLSHHPGNNDDQDDICHGTNGTTHLPGDHNVIQHPCQSHDNSIHKGSVVIAGHKLA